MKNTWFPALALIVGWSATGAHGVPGAPFDEAFRYGRYYTHTTVNADGTAVETYEWSKTVLKESAIEGNKRATISYSRNTQQAEVLAAYTMKADGRRLDVPKGVVSGGEKAGAGGVDETSKELATLTVVFPDLAVGDAAVLSYRLAHKEPMFAGHFSAAQLFRKDVAYDDVRVSFDYPATLWVQHEGRSMKESRNATEGGRTVVEWAWANPHPVRSLRRERSVVELDQEAGYAFSTFRHHADIAVAYGVRAHPKAVVTDRVAKLAAEIVRKTAGRKGQAKALYEWVATHIAYTSNEIGAGAVVPRDLDVVLDNGTGDCKDYATLLQALLAARGIRSTQVLLNSGPVYRLPKIPVSMSVNHVINYLPEFRLFLDSTSASTPFGQLPYGDQGKPVLLVEKHRNGIRTPVTPSSANRHVVRNNYRITGDGTIVGRLDVDVAGDDATGSREWVRKLSREEAGDLVRNDFRRMGLTGRGTFDGGDPRRLSDTYRYSAIFEASGFIKTPGAGAFSVFPPLGFTHSIGSAMQSMLESDSGTDVSCSGGTLIEEYTIELPRRMRVFGLPRDLKAGNEQLSYEATYRLEDRTLTVRRILVDHSRGRVCSAKVVRQFNRIARAVVGNLKEPVRYR